MLLLAALTALDTILHAIIVFRFGAAGLNRPVMIFAIIYLLLTLGLIFAVPYVVWAALILTLVGTIALTAAFRQIMRDKTIDRIIWVLNIVIVLDAAYLLFFKAAPTA
jgi:hypothetical protein